jgi:hypothetical protein
LAQHDNNKEAGAFSLKGEIESAAAMLDREDEARKEDEDEEGEGSGSKGEGGGLKKTHREADYVGELDMLALYDHQIEKMSLLEKIGLLAGASFSLIMPGTRAFSFEDPLATRLLFAEAGLHQNLEGIDLADPDLFELLEDRLLDLQEEEELKKIDHLEAEGALRPKLAELGVAAAGLGMGGKKKRDPNKRRRNQNQQPLKKRERDADDDKSYELSAGLKELSTDKRMESQPQRPEEAQNNQSAFDDTKPDIGESEFEGFDDDLNFIQNYEDPMDALTLTNDINNTPSPVLNQLQPIPNNNLTQDSILREAIQDVDNPDFELQEVFNEEAAFTTENVAQTLAQIMAVEAAKPQPELIMPKIDLPKIGG